MSRTPLTVWIFQTGEPLHVDSGDPRPMRAMNLADALVAAGHKVVLWSSTFYHQEKRQRTCAARVTVGDALQLRLIDSPGYQRNIGLGRLWDHLVLGRNLAQALECETAPPDVAFVGYPPIEAAAVMTRWLARRNIPCMLDVKDQWPTIFTDPLPAPLRPLGKLALAAYFYYGRRAMREATALSAMAGDFLQWAAGFAGRAIQPADRVVPLTMATGKVNPQALAAADGWWDAQAVSAQGPFRVLFVGTHSPAFDMQPVHAAASALAAKGVPVEFVICGDGPQSAAWRDQMRGLCNVRFPGWVNRAQVESLARRSHAALAPYRSSPDFVLSIPNKVIDALAFGLPILSPLQGEVLRLVTEDNAGMAYGPAGSLSLQQCIEQLREETQARETIASNARRVYRERFGFDAVYGGLVAHLESMARHEITAR